MTGVGWLSVKVGDIEGTQLVGHAGIEYVAGKRWSFGAGANLAISMSIGRASDSTRATLSTAP